MATRQSQDQGAESWQATQAAAEAKQDPYEGFTTRMADLIRAADEQAQKLLADAHSEAARTLSEARSEADRIDAGVFASAPRPRSGARSRTATSPATSTSRAVGARSR